MKTMAFLPRFHPLIRAGKKVCTARTKPMVKPRATVLVKDSDPPIRIQVLEISKIRLGDVAAHFHQEEGFSTPGGVIATWKEIHPRNGFKSSQIVFLHHFVVVPKDQLTRKHLR